MSANPTLTSGACADNSRSSDDVIPTTQRHLRGMGATGGVGSDGEDGEEGGEEDDER